MRLKTLHRRPRVDRRRQPSTSAIGTTSALIANAIPEPHDGRRGKVKMSELAKVLDEAQRRKGLTSDNALAKALGWPQATVSSYRRGARSMSLELALDLSEKTGIPVEAIARAVKADRESETRRAVGRKAA